MRAMLATLAVILCVAAPAAASAQAPATSVGISDQQWTTLVDPLADWLGFERARVIAPWDVALHESRAFDDWLQWAGWSGVEPLVSFERAGDGRLPSAAEYRAAFAAFRRRWPEVTTVSVWNEANHPGQPTANRPDAAAAYYRAVVEVCPSCRVLAGEVVDIPGMTSWLQRFQEALGSRPRLWGLHNYGDVTRLRDDATLQMLRTVDGDVWLTETGGLVRFELPDGTIRWPEDEARARAAIEYGFALADAHAERIPRMYLYNWREAAASRWDSGLISPGGRLRPGFWAVAERLRPGVPPPPEAVAEPTARAGGVARVTRRPRLDRRGRLRAQVTCPPGPHEACSTVLAVRTHVARDRRGRPRRPRDGRPRIGRDIAGVRAGRRRTLSVRLPRSRMRLIRAGRTRSLLADVWLGEDRPRRYRVRCARRR